MTTWGHIAVLGALIIVGTACGDGAAVDPVAAPRPAILPTAPSPRAQPAADAPPSALSPSPSDTTLRAPETGAEVPAGDPTPVSRAGQPTFVTVTYADGEFTPKGVEIDAGQSVEFVNASSDLMWPASNIHPTHQIYPEFDAKAPVAAGASWIFAFEGSGFWRYHNHLNPSQSGLVVARGEDTRTAVQPLVLSTEVPDFKPLGSVSADDAINLFRDDTTLARYIEDYGPAEVISLLSNNQSRMNVDCHQRAHEAGRMAYELFGALAFSLAGHECHAGGYHGATEALFRDRGTTNLHSDVGVLCGNTPNRFFRHQCVHGVGHGLMAWTSYELIDTLELCDRLDDGTDKRSCYSGAFMENIVGGLAGTMGHFTDYLSDDPHFPCNILDERYVPSCYFYQSSRMVQLSGGDFEQVAADCAAAPSTSHYVCFQSMGRDVGGATRGNPELAIKLCSHASDAANRVHCLAGAVQDSFWDASGADDALKLCSLLDGAEGQRRCYTTIVSRALQIYESTADRESFCGQIPEAHRAGCS